MIAVARGLTTDRAPLLADTLMSAGLNVLEVTMELGDGLAAIAALAGSPMTVGAGTVMSASEAGSAVGAGASFLVSPHLDGDLIAWAESHEVPFIPGVISPAEVARAHQLGSRAVKLFPSSFGGPALVSALSGPFHEIALIPTGGITAENAAEYLRAGAAAVGIGGWLTGPYDLDEVARRARAVAASVH